MRWLTAIDQLSGINADLLWSAEMTRLVLNEALTGQLRPIELTVGSGSGIPGVGGGRVGKRLGWHVEGGRGAGAHRASAQVHSLSLARI